MLREKPDRKEHVARDSGNGGRRPSWREADRWLLGLAWRSLADCKGAPRDFTPGLHVTQLLSWPLRGCVRVSEVAAVHRLHVNRGPSHQPHGPHPLLSFLSGV